MAASDEAKVLCEACNRSYKWDEKYAGKKVKCKCGQVMRFPDQPPQAAAADVYELNTDDNPSPKPAAPKPAAPRPAAGSAPKAAPKPAPAAPVTIGMASEPEKNADGCPSCGAEVRPGAVICINCGFNIKEGRKLETAIGKPTAGVQTGSGGKRGRKVYSDPADGFFGRVGRSWEYAKISYGIIWDFKQLVLFPIFSSIAALLVLATFIVPVVMMGFFSEAEATPSPVRPAAVAAPPTVERVAGEPSTDPALPPGDGAVAAAPPPPAWSSDSTAAMDSPQVDQAPAAASPDAMPAEATLGEDEEDGNLTAAYDSPAENESSTDPVMYVVAFAFYFCNYFVIAFFNTALVACAMKVAAGEVPTMGYGFKVAVKRLPQIAAWAAVSALIGLIIKIIENSSEKLGKIIAAIMGTAWTILTFFVVPVLAVEGLGPVAAIKRSVQVLHGAWGEAVVGNFSLGILGFLLSLPIFLVVGGLVFLAISVESLMLAAIAVLAGVVLLIILAAANSAADIVFKALLYNYATGGNLPGNIDDEVFAAAFAGRK